MTMPTETFKLDRCNAFADGVFASVVTLRNENSIMRESGLHFDFAAALENQLRSLCYAPVFLTYLWSQNPAPYFRVLLNPRSLLVLGIDIPTDHSDSGHGQESDKNE